MTPQPEPTPEGYLTLSGAFDIYQRRLGTGNLDEDMAAYLCAYRDGGLSAKAVFPAKNGLFDVSSDLWSAIFFAERILLEPVAAETWNEYRGGTFMVLAQANECWISGVEKKYDPAGQEYWSWPMAAAWVATSNMGEVRKYWSRYREETGRRPASPIVSDEMSAARQFLRARWESGRLRVLGVDSEGKVVDIPAHEISELHLSFDDSYQDEWRSGSLIGPVVYRSIRLPQPVLRHMPASRRKPVPSQVTFSGDETTLTLYEASLWVSMKGNSGEVPDGALEDGAAELFKLLATTPGLEAQAIDRATYLPCEIPKPYWVMATTDPEGQGHVVSFLDTEFKETGGMLTPKGEAAPKWGRISIPGEALRSAAPHVPHVEGLPDWVGVYVPPTDAGRHSSKELILQALKVRAEAGDLEDTLGNEAAWLSGFVTRCGTRGWPATSAATIEKLIRQEYRALKEDRTK